MYYCILPIPNNNFTVVLVGESEKVDLDLEAIFLVLNLGQIEIA